MPDTPDATAPRHRWASAFVSMSDRDRHRRPVDMALVVIGVLLIMAAAFEIDRPAILVDSATTFGQHLPPWIATLLGAVLAFGGGYIIVLAVLAALSPPHRRLLRDLLLGALATAVLAVSLATVVLGDSPSVEALWSSGGRHFPELRVALVTALVLIAAPFVVQPVRRTGRVVVVLGACAGVALQFGDSRAVAASIGLGMAVSGCVHLVFGSPGGGLSTAEVRALLLAHGLGDTDLARGSGRTAGPARFHLTAPDGSQLTAHVFGRDAVDMQLAAKSWRTLWYRNDGPFIVGRMRQAEHRALIALLCAKAGVRAPEFVALIGSDRGDAIVVTGQPAGGASIIAWTRDRAQDAWHQLCSAHHAGIALGTIDHRTFTTRADGTVEISSFHAATLSSDPLRFHADRAGLLVLTAVGLGPAAALEVASTQLSAEDLAHTTPLLQPAAVSPPLRRAVKVSGMDLTDLRDLTAQHCGDEPAPLMEVRRVTVRSILSTAASLFAVWILVSMLAGVDAAMIVDVLSDSIWWWVVVALLLGQLSRLGGAVSVLGASVGRLALGPTWVLQIAITFINLAVPGSAARLASVMRYYQKQGADRTDALTASVLDSVGGLLVQLTVLFVTLGLGLSTMTFGSADPEIALHGGRLIALAAVGVVLGLVVVLAVKRLRRWVVGVLRQAGHSVAGLRSARRASMLFGGNLTAEVLNATALGMCTFAVGHSLPFVDLIAINIVVAIFAGLMPVPGGIGVTEAALAGGLALAGIPEGEALAAALLYRAVTFYLPPVWGFFCLRWLKRHDYI